VLLRSRPRRRRLGAVGAQLLIKTIKTLVGVFAVWE
jgi:hypothetical protein